MRRKRYGDEEKRGGESAEGKIRHGYADFKYLADPAMCAGHSRRSENSSGWLGDCAGGNSCVDRIYFVGWAAYHSSQ